MSLQAATCVCVASYRCQRRRPYVSQDASVIVGCHMCRRATVLISTETGGFEGLFCLVCFSHSTLQAARRGGHLHWRPLAASQHEHFLRADRGTGAFARRGQGGPHRDRRSGRRLPSDRPTRLGNYPNCIPGQTTCQPASIQLPAFLPEPCWFP